MRRRCILYKAKRRLSEKVRFFRIFCKEYFPGTFRSKEAKESSFLMIRFSEIPYSEASFKSALFGRLAPIEFTIECSAGNAAAPITLNPLFSTSVLILKVHPRIRGIRM